MKIYIGCALTAASPEFVNGILKLKKALRKDGLEVMDFVGLVGGTPRDVYEHDIGQCVRNCDAFVAICDYPSIGLGFELNEALRLNKRVLAIAGRDAAVTRLVQGAAEAEDFELIRYENMEDAKRLVLDWLDRR